MAIKAQALDDFIAEFTHDAISEPEMVTLEKQDQDNDIARWKLFVDGSSN